MNPDLLGGILTLAACTAALIGLAPISLRVARTAYAVSVEEPVMAVRPPSFTAYPAPRRIRASDDPFRPLRPAA